jgi:hypothetical protein
VNKPPRKANKVIIGDEKDSVDGFTRRVLLSLVIDVTELRETAERLQISVFTLAKEAGIKVPE